MRDCDRGPPEDDQGFEEISGNFWREFLLYGKQIEKFDKNPAIFYIWGHSYELEALNNWNVMETLLNRIGRRTDIWYATNIAVYDYMKAFHRLNFSAETTFVKNPSAISVWIEKKGEILEIPAGETKELPE